MINYSSTHDPALINHVVSIKPDHMCVTVINHVVSIKTDHMCVTVINHPAR
jgi:hypothetical protein